MWRHLAKTAILFGTILWICGAQEQKKELEFEVASVKPVQAPPPFSVASGQVYVRYDADHFEARNYTLVWFISFAFGIPSDRISGPPWMGEQYFQVAAKLPPGSGKAEIPAMMQKLLADRFKLSLHRDRKVEPVYELVVDKKGERLKPSTVNASERGCMSRPGQCLCRANTLGQLADFLSGIAKFGASMAAMAQADEFAEQRIDRPVVNQTGLTGIYDIDLEWVPPGGLPNPLNNPDSADFPARAAAAKANSIFGALEAIGLNLQPARHSFDTLVIDHLERIPSEN